MQPSDEEGYDIDQRIATMRKSISDFCGRCYENSAFCLANDLIRLARREQRLVPMLVGQFQLVNVAQNLYQNHRAREVAIEMIALLESPGRARQIQADFSEHQYGETRAWMTACAYDNLAKHTGYIHGHNSEGLHQCIAEGIEVCRRTGKLRCIACFREYASDVYLAADDIEMALHFSTLVASQSENDPGKERRWVGANDRAAILGLMADLPAAKECLLSALRLADTFHCPLLARMNTLANLETVAWLMGEPGEFSAIAHKPLGSRDLPVGENLKQDCRWDYRDAVAACCNGDFAGAIELLVKWDTRFHQDNLSHEWFEARLRLIAARRLAGQRERIDTLAQPLFQRAQKSRDWLTLRRLRRLLDPTEPITPTAMLAAPRVGPFAPAGVTVPANVPTAARLVERPDTTPLPHEEPPPLSGVYRQMVKQMRKREDDNATTNVLQQVLELSPAAITDPRDAASFVHLLHSLLRDGGRFDEIWTWAEQASAPFLQTSYVLSLLATLAEALCACPDSKMSERIEAQRIDALYRQSLDLDPNNALNHARAGDFYLRQRNTGEAERCLARGFRLQRDNSYLAFHLAKIYQRTDRPRDALAVLDLCLREGSEDAKIAWEAAMTAQRLAQYESLLTYLDRFNSLRPDQPWVEYYRAIGLLEQGQPAQAIEALATEEGRSPNRPFGIEILRACAASALGLSDRYRRHLECVLAHRWCLVDYFSIAGLSNLAARLWKSGTILTDDDELMIRLSRRLILSGLAPKALFKSRRHAGERTAKVTIFRCTLRQPLDACWGESPGCLHGQSAWTEYQCQWGVLARDEDKAHRLSLAQQAECYDIAATVIQVEDLHQTYTDKPGIIWQGARWLNADGASEDRGP